MISVGDMQIEGDDILSPDTIELDKDLFRHLGQFIDDDKFEFDLDEIMLADREREKARELEMQRLRERVTSLEARLNQSQNGNKITHVSCPFCPFTVRTTSGFRPLKMHLASGSCMIPVQTMVHTSCTHPSDRFCVGESGESCLVRTGFKNPYDIENEFYHFKCKSCNFRHWHKSKYTDHIAKCDSTKV